MQGAAGLFGPFEIDPWRSPVLKVGIVGLPNVGKSTLFNALTSAGAPADNYPFCTVDPNVGTVEVPDPRLRRIQEVVGSADMTPAFIHFVDIAGLVEGASKGEGLGNQFLAQIREVDAVAHVLRCFRDPDVTHVEGEVDPLRDKEIVETELALADLEVLERRLEKVEKKARSGERDAAAEEQVLLRLKATVSEGRPVRGMRLSEGDRRTVRELHLLTAKPVLYVANVSDQDPSGSDNELVGELRRVVEGHQDETVVPVSCAIEAELAELTPGDRAEFLESLGLDGSGLDRLIHAAYGLLELVTFFTTNERETRAWTVKKGTRAPEAAGEVHSDFQKGFIRAETIPFEEFDRMGSMKDAREAGLVRSEGKDYSVADGDILLFRHNV